MKNINFYVCPLCGNILTCTTGSDVTCCGKKLEALTAQAESGRHTMKLEEIEDDYFVTIDHDMTKEHHFQFAAVTGYDRVLLIRLYPEQSAEFRFPKMRADKIYSYCNIHGLFEKDI